MHEHLSISGAIQYHSFLSLGVFLNLLYFSIWHSCFKLTSCSFKWQVFCFFEFCSWFLCVRENVCPTFTSHDLEFNSDCIIQGWPQVNITYRNVPGGLWGGYSCLVLVGMCHWEFEKGPIQTPIFKEKVTRSYPIGLIFDQILPKITWFFLQIWGNFSSNYFLKNNPLTYKILHKIKGHWYTRRLILQPMFTVHPCRGLLYWATTPPPPPQFVLLQSLKTLA